MGWVMMSERELGRIEVLSRVVDGSMNTDADWRKVIGQALDCQAGLEAAAEAERADTGEYIRPIILFQAQAKSKTDPHRLTPEAVVQFLTDDKRIPRNQIAIHATGHAELDAIADIASPDCPVRYVVTVPKLREGWDCPFAYILCKRCVTPVRLSA
jgi:type III restriction enzyme